MLSGCILHIVIKDVLQKSAASREPRGRLNPIDFHEHVDFQTFAPPADLAPFIEHFWVVHTKQNSETYSSEQLMHRPYIDIFISAQQSGIQGTFCNKRLCTAAADTRIIDVRFHPGAFHAFNSGSMVDLRGAVVELAQVFPSFDAQCIQKLLVWDDQVIFSKLIEQLRMLQPKQDTNIELVRTVIDMVEANDTLQTVASVAGAIGKSERWLQHLFQEYVGVGLKWFLQTKRLLAAAQRIRGGAEGWAALAYDAGYSSQQHFITDFKRVICKTPRQYKMELG